MAHKLIVNRGDEEQVHEFGDICEAFDAAEAWLMKGYVARITDKHGVVKHTQALSSGQIVTYPGDATDCGESCATSPKGQSPSAGPKQPWWRFW